VARKVGQSAMTQLAINATVWQKAHWALEKGLYAQVYEEADQLDAGVQELAGRLAASNPESMRLLKQAFWQGTDHWDELLEARAAMSGKLVLGRFTREAIERFKQKAG